MAKHALKPVHSNYSKLKLIIPIVTAGALLSCTAVVAQADTGQNHTPASVSAVTAVTAVTAQENTTAFTRESTVVTLPEVSAPTAAKLSFERTMVTTVAAPKPAPQPVVEAANEAPVPAATPDAAPAPVAAPAVAQVAAAAAVSPADPANIPAALGTSNGTADSFGAKVVAEALALAAAHTEEDCTMLVTNSLKAAGVNFHGWPADYLSLGSITTTPQPGDLIYYRDGGMGLPHIAVFLSPGKAIHGGWNGHTTAIGPANLGSGPIYIHVKR